MATWAVVKAQARDILGIQSDRCRRVRRAAARDRRTMATSSRGPTASAMVMMKGAGRHRRYCRRRPRRRQSAGADQPRRTPCAPATSSSSTSRTAPIRLGGLGRRCRTTRHSRSADAAAARAPTTTSCSTRTTSPATAASTRTSASPPCTRIFHSEHNRLVEQTKRRRSGASNDVAFLNQWLLAPVATLPTTQPQIDALQWNGERLFQAAKFGTEMQYQHLVFEEFARTMQPQCRRLPGARTAYDTTINPAIVAEFAHTVYRFGHSMLTETVDRFDPTSTSSRSGDARTPDRPDRGLPQPARVCGQRSRRRRRRPAPSCAA